MSWKDFKTRAIKANSTIHQDRAAVQRASKTLADLVLALDDESQFSVSALYLLDLEHFELAMELLDEWRLDRFYMGKAKLFDLSWQHRDLRGDGAPSR